MSGGSELSESCFQVLYQCSTNCRGAVPKWDNRPHEGLIRVHGIASCMLRIGHCLYATHAPLITFGPHDAFLLCCAVTCLLHVTNMCVLVEACDRGTYFPGTEGTFCLSCQAGHYQNVTRSYNEHGMIFSQLHSLLAFA